MAENEQWAAGIHAVTELLNKNPEQIRQLLIQKGRADKRLTEVLELAESLDVSTLTVDRKQLDEKVGSSHQGVAAQCLIHDSSRDEKFLWKMLDSLSHAPLLLVLDEITDPHNLGACLRSADAAGVDAVIIPRDRSASMNLTVRKVASGAAETVTLVTVTNLSRTLKALQERGVWIAGAADAASDSLFQQDLTGPIALVMGSEGKGLRRLTRETCDFLLAIPMAGTVSSLNVSVATGICLFEVVRQRQKAATGNSK